MSETFQAYHLPRDADSGPLERKDGPLPFQYPRLTPDFLNPVLHALRQAGRAMADRPVPEIIAAIDAAAARIADPADPIGGEARRLVPRATGYSDAMADLVIHRMAADWREEPLRRLLNAELGGSAVLDRFIPAGPHRRTRAYPPALSFHVFAGNVPGVGVTSLVRSLLVRGPVMAKVASDEPVLPVLFARALASVDASLADALAVTYWPGGSQDVEDQVLAEAELVVAYGGDRAVASVRQRAPAGRRVVIHGPRFSTGLIADGAQDDGGALASDVARAVATFDQQGCVSPHAIWVEDPDGTRTGPFVDALAAELARLEQELPRGAVNPGEAAAIQQERGAAELRGMAVGGGRVVVGAGTSWTVVLDPEPVFRPSCLNRFVRVHPVADLGRAVQSLSPHGQSIQSVAIAAPEPLREALADDLARIGVTRVSSFSRLPWPPPEWHHDGSSPLRELLRWVDLED